MLFLPPAAAPARVMIPRISSSRIINNLFIVDLDLGATVLAEQHAVACINIQWLARSVFLVFAKACGNHFAFLRFLFRRVRNDDAAANLFAFINAFHDHAVVQWLDIRRHNFFQSPFGFYRELGCGAGNWYAISA